MEKRHREKNGREQEIRKKNDATAGLCQRKKKLLIIKMRKGAKGYIRWETKPTINKKQAASVINPHFNDLDNSPFFNFFF